MVGMWSRRARILGGATGLLVLGLAGLSGGTGSAATTFSFALIGDVPYSDADVASMGGLVADVNNDPDVRFVAHVGDVKAGELTCSDAVLTARFDLFQAFDDPFWFTPGDNEWTDCHAATPAYNPLNRLAKVRSLFYPVPTRTTGGSSMAVTPQSAPYVENVWFQRDCVTFGSIHQVGSLNGLEPWTNETPAQKTDRENEVAGRIAADVAWVDRIFDQATTANSAGVFLLIHEKPSTGAGTVDVRDRIEARARAFGKPVILANGSEHVYEVEPGFLGVGNVTRWQTTGGPGAVASWLKVGVDCSSVSVFSHSTVNTGTTPPTTTLPPPLSGIGPAAVDAHPTRGTSILIP
jgi:hypothetical protein